jgi:serine phosphatase RsbU (regulator of sigma subunit)
MFPELASEEAAVPLEFGNWLVITSDGISEATDENGEDFGDMRLVAMLDRSASTDNFCCAALNAVTSFAGNKTADDLTIIAARLVAADTAAERVE